LIFNPERLEMVRGQIVLLSNQLEARFLDINQLYNHIVGSFTYYGLQQQRPRSVPLSDEWTTFLRDDEVDVSFEGLCLQGRRSR
jgi:hypothetical protein